MILIVLIKLIAIVLIEPWVEKKILTAFNEKYREYTLEIGKVHILICKSGIDLEMITFSSKQGNGYDKSLRGEIASVKVTGIRVAKAIFKKNLDISEVIVTSSSIEGKMPFPKDSDPAQLSSANIRIGKILFDKTDLAIVNTGNAQAFSLKEGVLKVYSLQIEKLDTISPGIIKQFDFEAKELQAVSADSMYSFIADRIAYSATSKKLAVQSFYIKPNYSNYNFTARNTYETIRFEALFSNVFVHGFPAMAYLQSGSLISTYINIGEMKIDAFRDKRKELRHVTRPEFQDMIYNYPGTICIDTIVLISGNVNYTVHAKMANEPGNISFNDIHTIIFRITNDTVYKTNKAFLELNGETLIMGKGRMTVNLKAEIFNNHNSFSLNGTLSNMEAKELNPILEKNAFVYATSGKIDAMNFSFMANSVKATGKMTLLYHELDLAVKNKRTDDTTAIKERIISFIANRKVLDSNPIPGNEVREGIIDYERDPEKFLFHYCFKSVLTGVQSTLVKDPG